MESSEERYSVSGYSSDNNEISVSEESEMSHREKDTSDVVRLALCFTWLVIAVGILCYVSPLTIVLTPPIAGNFISYRYSGRTKYFLAACFKSEGYYLEDWIRYHLSLGFDGVYLCDNNVGADDLKYVRQIEAQFPQVQVINKRNKVYDQEGWFIEMYRKVKPGDWCLFIDIDEFLTFGENMSLYRYISMVRKTPCQQIKINAMTFGNNKEVFMRPGSVRDRFRRPILDINAMVGRDPINQFAKSFIIGGITDLRFPLMHYAVARRMCSCTSDFNKVSEYEILIPPTYKYAYYRHYKTRSEQEWCLKMRRWNSDPKYGSHYRWNQYDEVNRHPPNQLHTGIIDDNCSLTQARVVL